MSTGVVWLVDGPPQEWLAGEELFPPPDGPGSEFEAPQSHRPWLLLLRLLSPLLLPPRPFPLPLLGLQSWLLLLLDLWSVDGPALLSGVDNHDPGIL